MGIKEVAKAILPRSARVKGATVRLKTLVTAFVTSVIATASFGVAAPSAAFAANGQLTLREVDTALQNISSNLVHMTEGVSSGAKADGTVHFTTKDAGDIVLTLPVSHTVHASVDGSWKYLNGNNAVVVRPTNGGAQTLMVAANKSAPLSTNSA